MKRRFYYLPFLLLVFLGHTVVSQVFADETVWTEKKLGRVILKAERAAKRKIWSRAIRYGEQMLTGSEALDQKHDQRYINLLKNLNKYYDNSHRLAEVPERIKSAYLLSKQHLGLSHTTSLISRNLYYKLLIAEKKYHDAIPLVLENISVSEKSSTENFRILHYLEQLSTLYRLTRQYAKEEGILLRFLEMNKWLVGKDAEDNIKIILSLAQNYCRQNKFDQFKQLIISNNLKYYCK